MIATLTTEFRKFFSTRMWWVLALCMAGYLVFMALVMGLAMGSLDGGAADAAFGEGELAKLVYSMATSVGFVFPAMVGAMAVTQEYRHKTLTPTFLADPNRPRVLSAKVLSSLPMGFVFGVIAMAATVIPGSIVLAIVGQSTGLTSASTWAMIARSILGLTMWAFVGVGFGALVTNQVAAIVVLLALTQFVEPMIRMIPMFIGRPLGFIKFLPGAAGDAIAGSNFYSSLAGGQADVLGWGWAVLVLAGYGALLAVVGYFTSFRRDVS
jgi:hypothetical protein